MKSRHLDLGERQGRGNPPLSRANTDEYIGMLARRCFWLSAAVSVLLWAIAIALGVMVYMRVTA